MVSGRFLAKTGLGRGLGMGEQGIPPPNELITLPSSALCYVDVTDTGSYTGGQLLTNRVISPADGSPSSAYNFFLGSSDASESTDPVFVGSLGSPDAYVLFDVNAILRLAANTTFISNIHRTDQANLEFTILLCVYWPSATGAFICGTGYSSGRPGFSIYFNPANPSFALNQYSASSSSSTEFIDASFEEDRWNLFGSGLAKISNNDGFFYTKLNSAAQANGQFSQVFVATTDAPNNTFQISGVDTVGLFPDDARLKAVLLFNEALNNAEIEAIRTQLATLHGVSYT